MNVLVFNCGSSSLKFQLLDPGVSGVKGELDRRIARGLIEGIGGKSAGTVTQSPSACGGSRLPGGLGSIIAHGSGL